jgi:zinc finger protein
MTNPSEEDFKPDGAAFDDYFESLGKKAEHLTINEQNGTQIATNGAPAQPAEEDQKVVDEIESLCMNCRENVSHSSSIIGNSY